MPIFEITRTLLMWTKVEAKNEDDALDKQAFVPLNEWDEWETQEIEIKEVEK